jgi:hypothetical protein
MLKQVFKASAISKSGKHTLGQRCESAKGRAHQQPQRCSIASNVIQKQCRGSRKLKVRIIISASTSRESFVGILLLQGQSVLRGAPQCIAVPSSV